MMTKEQALVADIRSSFLQNISLLERALTTTGKTMGYVHVWPKYWIGVKFNADVCHGVAVDLATVTGPRDKHVFTNGHGERTILMRRSEALQRALNDAKMNLATFDQQLVA